MPVALAGSERRSTTSSSEEWFESLYRREIVFLLAVAVQKFRVPELAAETLVHEVFLKYLEHPRSIDDLHGWLLAAVCDESRSYVRSHRVEGWGGRPVESSLDSTPDRLSDEPLDEPVASEGEAVRALSPRARQILRLRFFEGLGIDEIAKRLGLTPKYARHLVIDSLRHAEQKYRESEKRNYRRLSESESEALLYSLLAEFANAYRDL